MNKEFENFLEISASHCLSNSIEVAYNHSAHSSRRQ